MFAELVTELCLKYKETVIFLNRKRTYNPLVFLHYHTGKDIDFQRSDLNQLPHVTKHAVIGKD